MLSRKIAKTPKEARKGLSPNLGKQNKTKQKKKKHIIYQQKKAIKRQKY